MVLAIFSEIFSVRVEHGRGVEIHAGHFDFVNRDDQRHAVFLGQFLHARHGRAVRHGLGQLVPFLLLLRAEVRAVEKFLQAEDLHLAFCRGGDELLMLGDHVLFDFRQGKISWETIRNAPG